MDTKKQSINTAWHRMWQKSENWCNERCASQVTKCGIEYRLATWYEIYINQFMVLCNKRIGNKVFAHDALQTVSSSGNWLTTGKKRITRELISFIKIKCETCLNYYPPPNTRNFIPTKRKQEKKKTEKFAFSERIFFLLLCNARMRKSFML